MKIEDIYGLSKIDLPSGLTWQVATANITAADGIGYMMDTSGGALTGTLPSGVSGAKIGFKDYAQSFDTNNLTITPAAGENIEGQATPLIIDNQGWSGVLEYIDATKGWMLTESSPMGAWGTGSLVPAGGAANQVLSKIDGTDGNVQWTDPPKSGGLFTQDMTGLNAITLDCGQFDTFELNSMNTAATITLSNFTAGSTIVVVLENGAVGVTWADTIKWYQGVVPSFTPDVDTIVLTKLSNKITGTYSLGQK